VAFHPQLRTVNGLADPINVALQGQFVIAVPIVGEVHDLFGPVIARTSSACVYSSRNTGRSKSLSIRATPPLDNFGPVCPLPTLVGLCGSSEAALALNEVQAARCVGEVTMSNPVVSVCLPTYNGGAFLALTLKSIAAQTFEDYEVIIVDDQSTDDSVALVEQYAAFGPAGEALTAFGTGWVERTERQSLCSACAWRVDKVHFFKTT
jgi:hypothetical protein